MTTIIRESAYTVIMENDFVTWLNREMERRGWNNSELARRADVSPSTLSKAISGYNRPGLELCVGVADAFGLPPETVLRRAGLLPPSAEGDPAFTELLAVLRNVSRDELLNILEYAVYRHQQGAGKRNRHGTHRSE